MKVLVVAILVTLAVSQPARDNGKGISNLHPLKSRDDGAPRGRESCSPSFRTLSGRCNNEGRKEWGSARQALFSYERRHTSAFPSGQDLPSPRHISNVLSKQDGDIFNRRGLSELVTFFGQFLDHNIVATSADDDAKFDIEIPYDDPIFANFSGKLPFERSKRTPVFGRRKKRVAERPMNTLSSYVDLAAVYGADNERIKSLRSFNDGKLLTSQGDLLPFNTKGLFNAPTKDSAFFLAGDHRANEHPVLTSLHTIFVREHNLICDELKASFPDWNEEDVFQMARQINIAQFQKIVFEEYYPAITGRPLKPYQGYKRKVDAGISNLFATAAFRLGHTMVGNKINRRGPGMSPMSPLSMTEMFFRRAELMKISGIDPFVRGAIYGRAQEVDVLVHDALRNFLFTGIPEEKGFDLIALNLQRGRDHALLSYSSIRRFFKLGRVRSFKSITRDRTLQSKLANAYKTPSRVEAWMGLMAEDHIPGGSMGPTVYRIWEREFSRLRDGDRFYFKRGGLFPDEVWARVPRIYALYSEKELLKSIILRTTNINASELPGSVWTATEK